MTELLPNIFAIEVPADSKDFGCVHVFHGEDILYYPDSDGQTVPVAKAPCHCDQVEILFATKDCTEDQASKIVGQVLNGFYENYLTTLDLSGFEGYDKATESLQSLLKSKGLTGGNYLIIKKVEG